MWQVAPEQPGEFDGFIASDDEELERELLDGENSDDDDRDNAEWTPPPQFGRCMMVIGEDKDGTEYTCGEICNPAEQLCRDCKRGVAWGRF